jgi:hypothetical protein
MSTVYAQAMSLAQPLWKSGVDPHPGQIKLYVKGVHSRLVTNSLLI